MLNGYKSGVFCQLTHVQVYVKQWRAMPDLGTILVQGVLLIILTQEMRHFPLFRTHFMGFFTGLWYSNRR